MTVSNKYCPWPLVFLGKLAVRLDVCVGEVISTTEANAADLEAKLLVAVSKV